MATAAETRWLHYRPDESLGRFVPNRNRDGHTQYTPRHPGDTNRLNQDEIDRLHGMYTRTSGIRNIQEQGDWNMYQFRDPDEVRSMFLMTQATRDAARRGEHNIGWRPDAARGNIFRESHWRFAGRRPAGFPDARPAHEGRPGPIDEDGGEGERADMSAEEREYQRTQRGYATGDRGMLLASPYDYERYHRDRGGGGDVETPYGYFGEDPYGWSEEPRSKARNVAMGAMGNDYVRTRDRKHRSVRDLASQLWFDCWNEATGGAEGLCDLTVPSNPQAAANREVIGATPSVMEGLERLVRSGDPNAVYHACEALSQIAFRNTRNAQRIMDTRNPDLPTALAALLSLSILQGGPTSAAPLGPTGPLPLDYPPFSPPLDDASAYDILTAVLRALNNCAWGSPRASLDMADHPTLLDDVETLLQQTLQHPAIQNAPRLSEAEIEAREQGLSQSQVLPAYECAMRCPVRA